MNTVGVLPAALNRGGCGSVPAPWQPAVAQVVIQMVEPCDEIGVTSTPVDAGPCSAAALVAFTVQLTLTLLTSVVTVIGEEAPFTVTAPQVAAYDAIGLPPLLIGAVKATTACVSPGVTVVMDGAPGAMAVMVTLRVTCAAAATLPLPA